jgi:general secretion pathway protein G
MQKRLSSRAGLTLIELIVAFTLMMLLTTMAVPMARSRVRRNRERDLRVALDEMRKGIDKYKDQCDAGKLGIQKQDAQCYPESLDAMVEGVKGSGTNADTKLKFLRRVPQDPLTRKREWGVRSMQDDPKGQGGGGQNVFDVFTKSSEKAGDGTPYSEW